MNMEKEHKGNGKPNHNWLLIYVMCPILVMLSAAAIIYTFKELPKISVLRKNFDKHEKQFQNNLETQNEELREIKLLIAKLAEKTGNLDSETVDKLITFLEIMEKKVEYQAIKKTEVQTFYGSKPTLVKDIVKEKSKKAVEKPTGFEKTSYKEKPVIVGAPKEKPVVGGKASLHPAGKASLHPEPKKEMMGLQIK